MQLTNCALTSAHAVSISWISSAQDIPIPTSELQRAKIFDWYFNVHMKEKVFLLLLKWNNCSHTFTLSIPPMHAYRLRSTS